MEKDGTVFGDSGQMRLPNGPVGRETTHTKTKQTTIRAKRAQKGSNDLSTIHPIDTRALPGYLKREGS